MLGTPASGSPEGRSFDPPRANTDDYADRLYFRVEDFDVAERAQVIAQDNTPGAATVKMELQLGIQ